MADQRRQRTRERILLAACDLFLTHGYLGTSMDAVTAHAGVSKQTVYAHFSAKEALFLDVIAHVVGGASSDHRARVDAPGADEPLRDFLLRFLREDLAIVLTPRLMQLRRLVIGEQSRFPELAAQLFTHGPQASIDALTSALRIYQERGALAPCDPERAAEQLNWLTMGGPVSRAMLLGDGSLLPEREQEAHAHACVDVFVAAFGIDLPDQTRPSSLISRRATMPDDKIEVESVLSPGRTTRVDRARYEAMRRALLPVLPEAPPGIRVAEAREALLPSLDAELFPGGAKAGWWLKCVQLDLEAKGVIRRAESPPVRLFRVAPR